MIPQVLVILQNHYVETLGRGIVFNLPYLLNFFYKGISPFLDPITREKVVPRPGPSPSDLALTLGTPHRSSSTRT